MLKSLTWISRVLGLGLLCAGPVNAGVIAGHITSVQVYPQATPTDYAFRVSLDATVPAACATGGFYYADMTYSNYQALVATSLTAFSLGKNVQVEYNPGGGYCALIDIVVQQ